MRILVSFAYGYTCDKPDCRAVLELDEGVSSKIREAHEKALVAAGWTSWLSNIRREYCPDHGPHKGSRARRVLPPEALS